MRKEIAPELYNYNKFPGPSFARVGDKVVAEQIELDILEEHRQAFDQTAFGQRFSPLLLKFDYIVGDWGNDQLRLKGFYKDERVVKSDAKIGRLEDYLKEYCNFGCAYFVLGNANPQDLPIEKEDIPRRRRKKKSRPVIKNEQEIVSYSKRVKSSQPSPKKMHNSKRHKKQVDQDVQDAKRHFVIRQK